MRHRAVSLAAIAALLLVSGVVFGVSRPAAAAEQCFPQTGKCIGGLFYDYWLANGGLAQQGYPITDEFNEVSPTNGQTYRVQYFERARFEYHPENVGTRFEVLLGLLGREQYLVKYPSDRPPGGTGEVCFEATNRCIRGGFYAYWQANGGLAQQGLPLSDEFDEINPTDGKTYRTQYFERARFEYHPENAGTRFEVLLGLLGREQFLAKYPNGQPGNVAPSPAPTRAATATPTARPPAPTPTTVPPSARRCDPSYPDVCIPPPPPDLDCKDIPYRNFRVLPPDPHRFDTDGDGIGCETP